MNKEKKENYPAYYAIIPANVRYNKNLPPNAKLLFGEITALCNKEGFCWATNRYFAKIYNVDNSSITRWIALLKTYGYICLKMQYKKGTKNIEHRNIYVTNEDTPILKNKYTPILKNEAGINTSTNKDTVVSIMRAKCSLKQLQIKYNGILSRTIINIGGYKTRINNNSKTMITVYKHLITLQHNKFLTGKNFDNKPSLTTRDTFRINKIMTDDQLEAILKKASKRWKLIFTDENYNSPDTRPSLNDFFYNVETGMSYFIYCTCCTLMKKNQTVEINKLESLVSGLKKMEPKLQELTLKLYNKNVINNFSKKDQIVFYSNIKKLIEWRLENKDQLEKVNDGWGTLFGGNGVMFATVSRFMEEHCTEYLPNFLIVAGYLWNDFNEWCVDGYGVDLKLKGR